VNEKILWACKSKTIAKEKKKSGIKSQYELYLMK
jgi:hypothetical protein